MSRAARLFRWFGAAAFVSSLASTAYAFIVAWAPSDAAAHDLPAALAGNAALFTLFALHHSLFARARVKRWVGRLLPDSLERSAYVWLASLLLALTVLGWQRVGHELYRATGPWRSLLTGVQLAGVALTIAAARRIDVFALAGLRSGAGGDLDVRGPYGLVRHPIYLGWLLMVWGAPVMTGDRCWFALISTTYLLLAIPWEEAAMARTMGAAYDGYRSRVPSRLIPGIY